MDKIRRNLCAQTLDYRVLLPWTLSSGERNSIPPLFRCSTHHRVIDLQKVISDCFMVTQDNRAPIVGSHSITPWMMLTSFRMSKESFFRTLNIEKRRSIQFEDADNQVSDPTDLGEKLDYNLFNIITDIVRKCWRAEIWKDCAPRIQNSQMFCSSNDHRSANRIQHRTRSGTCGSVHKPSFDSTFQLSLRNSANPCGLCCAMLVPGNFLP